MKVYATIEEHEADDWASHKACDAMFGPVEVDCDPEEELSYLDAIQVAEFYYDHCDGWEDREALTGEGLSFHIYDESKAYLKEFSVVMEFEPRFYADEV